MSKRAIYHTSTVSVVLSVLHYEAETWTIKASYIKRLSSFHNRCIRAILGATKYKQLKDRITSKQLTSEFGMEEPLEDLVMKYRLRWLGHLGKKGKGKTTKDDIAWRAGKEDMGRGVGPIQQVRRSPDQYSKS